jgi:peptide/nickel transport system substrate-binding protein
MRDRRDAGQIDLRHGGGVMSRTKMAGLVVLLLAAVAWTAQSATSQNGATKTQVVQSGGTLIAARAADVVLWDPAHINENDSLWAGFQTNANLIMTTPDGKGFQPYVAQSWTITKGGKVFTFKLYPTAKFCDGSRITAQDVVFSFKRASKPKAIVSWQYPKGMKIRANGPGAVVITLPTANASFLSYLTLWGTAIVSQKYAAKVGDKGLASKPLGSGPFCLKSWRRGAEIDLARNPYFWLKDKQGKRLPYLDAVKWRIIKDDTARVVALRSGQVEVITPVPPAQFNQLKSASGVRVGESPLLGTVSLFLNFKVPALADQKVRQALNYAIDKNGIVKAVLFGHGRQALSPLFLANYTTEKYGYRYNLDKAKSLMAASKFPKGFTATVTYTGGDSIAQQTLVILKAQWAQIGVTINLKPIEEGVYFSTWSSGKWDMMWVKATNDIYDPAENLHFEMMGKEGGSDSGWSGYENKPLNALVLAAEKEMNKAKRTALYDRIQRIYMLTGPQAYLFHPSNLWATRSNVHDFRIYKTGLHPFMFTWKTR